MVPQPVRHLIIGGRSTSCFALTERTALSSNASFGDEKNIKSRIDQLFNQLTERDTKVALLLFSKNVRFTDVLAKTAIAIAEHQDFK